MANVGGMALNVRFLQKVGIEPARAVTGIGLNVAAGGIVHVVLLFAFLAWAGRSDANAFHIPSTASLGITNSHSTAPKASVLSFSSFITSSPRPLVRMSVPVLLAHFDSSGSK